MYRTNYLSINNSINIKTHEILLGYIFILSKRIDFKFDSIL